MAFQEYIDWNVFFMTNQFTEELITIQISIGEIVFNLLTYFIENVFVALFTRVEVSPLTILRIIKVTVCSQKLFHYLFLLTLLFYSFVLALLVHYMSTLCDNINQFNFHPLPL